jgi:uncharacterized membrane protein YtjA (UPF0391 family)
MLGWAILFLIIALCALGLGMFVATGIASLVAKVIFVVFIVLFGLSFTVAVQTPRT